MICKNCGKIAEGNYCSNCGQKTNYGRLNYSYLSKEITGSVFQLEYGFFYTLKELFIAPGKSINEFLNGRRKRYFKPVSYLLITSTIYFLVTLAIDEKTWIGDFISGWNAGSSENDSEIQPVLMWFSEKYAYTTLLIIPIFSFASYLSFFNYNKNYVEHIVINSFITGQQALLYSFFAVFGLIFENKILEIAPFFVSASYNILVYYKVFKEGKRVINILRSIFAYIVFLIFSAGLFIFIFLVSKI